MSKMKAVYDQAAADPKYRDRLKSNPAAVLKAAGVEVPDGKTVEVIEAQRDELHLFVGVRSAHPPLDRLLERVEKDESFRKEFQANPKRLLEEATGEKLPATVQVRVHEPGPNRICVLLPRMRDTEEELSDLELEGVAGGGKLGTWLRDAFCRNVTHHQYGAAGAYNTMTDYSATVEVTTYK